MQDDPPEDEPEESQSDKSDVDDGDAVDVSGIEIEVGNTEGAVSNAEQELPQNLVLGDSLAGDIESIVASDVFVDEGLASVVLETDGSGSLLVQGSELKDNKEISGIESSGIIEDKADLTDVGSLSREARGPFGIDYAKMTFWEFLFGGVDVEDWDVDLGEFLKDFEEDPDAATMLGTANEFDLDAGLEDDIEDAMHPNAKEFELDAEPNDIYGSEGCIDFDCDPDASQAVINQETVQETVTVIEDSKPTTAPHWPKRKLWKQVYHYGYLLILFAIALFILWLGIMERLGIGYLPLPW